MIFPEDISKINTNLSYINLIRAINAVKENKIEWGNTTVYGNSRLSVFFYEGQKFELIEFYEKVSSLYTVKKIKK